MGICARVCVSVRASVAGCTSPCGRWSVCEYDDPRQNSNPGPRVEGTHRQEFGPGEDGVRTVDGSKPLKGPVRAVRVGGWEPV